mgnify:CR=1 FL=1
MAGLYIHIPFCESKCAYCDFYSLPHTTHADEYMEALMREYRARRHEITSRIETIYLGGGTPSMLGRHRLERLFAMLSDLSPQEFTIEVNPEHIDRDFARFLSDSPINRVSMGIQSLCDNELAAISRRHTATRAIEAVEHLKNAGIVNLSLDLIFGLPEQTLRSWSYTLDRIIAMHPQHISAYSLMLEPGTRLYAMFLAGKIKETPQELSEAMYNHLCHRLDNESYQHYEISNFALEGYRSQHNSSYWNFTPYLGLGAGAHSFDGNIRRYNPADLKVYLSTPEHSFITEHTAPHETFNEYLLVRLRTKEGIDLTDMEQRFGPTRKNLLLKSALPYIESGSMLLDNGSLSIAPHHWLISDSILVELFAGED